MNKVSVLGGNPKVEVREGRVVVSDPQMLAFQEAMKLVASVRDRVHRIAVAFDHKGIFGDQFVDHFPKAAQAPSAVTGTSRHSNTIC